MSYKFSASEIDQLSAARLLCPAGDAFATSSGNWVPFYSKLSGIIKQHIEDFSVAGSDLQDMKNAKLWLDVAIGANGGTGMHSAFIRAYTNKQGKLRLGNTFSDAEMQLASNGVALNLWRNFNDPTITDTYHALPSIREIAAADAASIGLNLFKNKLSPDDTAIKSNAAWSGALGFNLLGGSPPYESWRLLTGGDGQTTGATLNTLDDVKNVLYAAISYQDAFKAGAIAGGGDFLVWLSHAFAWAISGLWTEGAINAQVNIAASSGNWFGFLSTVSARTPSVGKTISLINDIGISHFLDMLMGAVQAKPLIGTTTDANFETSAKAFFSNYTSTQLQTLKAELLPSDIAALTAKGKSDVNARAALMALSAISVEVSGTIASKLDLYDVTTGKGHISEKWLEDRASMVSWLKVKFQMETSGAVSNAIDGPGSRYFDQASNTEVLIGTLPTDRKQYLFGSNNTDNLSGQDLDDHLFGGDGRDKLSGAGGADYLEGDDGNDSIDGGAGNDTVLGGDGSDEIKGAAGTDKLSGDSGDDTLDGGADADTLVGGKGNDKYTFSGAYGSDIIKDEDGQGSVVIDSITMTGGKREEGKPYYYDKPSNTYYYWAGSTLSIYRKGSQGNVTVQNWANGQLGIRLLEDIPKPRPVVDPIILDLDSDGIETLGLDAKVHFDHAKDGFAELTGWAGPDDGLLARDLDGDGKITTGRELFGSETLLSGGAKAANGFSALAELDINKDNIVSGAETATLRVWRDINHNGVTDEGELQTLADAGVRSINTGYVDSRTTDNSGNQHQQLGSYIGTDGSTRSAVDVWLLGDPSDTIATDTSTVISADIAALPNIEGYGKLPSLHASMAKDPALKSLVSQFSQPGATDRATLVRDILWRWTGADKQVVNSRGTYIKDARWLYVVEAFTGSPFTQVGGINNGTANPGPIGSAEIYVISKRVYEILYARLGTQSHIKNVQDAVVVTWNDAGSTFSTDVSNTISILRAGIVANRASGLAVLSDFVRSLRTFGQFTADIQNQLVGALSDLGTDVSQKIQSPTTTGFGLDFVASTIGQTVLGTPQSDTLVGTVGDDVLSGDASNDSLIGGWGNDVLDGGLGADKLFGNDGADTYIFGRTSGQDTIDNFDQDQLGTQADRILFSAGVKPQDVATVRSGNDLILTINGTGDRLTVVNFYAFAESGFFNNGTSQIESIQFADPAYSSTIWSVEDIRGKTHIVTQGDDRLTGVATNDVVNMLGGNDTVYGLGGNDAIDGGAGSDQLFGGSGLDTIDGGAGNDVVDGGIGDDTYWFGLGDGHDTLREGFGSGWADSGGTDTLRIRSGVLPETVKISRDRTDIILSLPGHIENQVYVYDSIRLQNALDNDGQNTYSIEVVKFDNDVTWKMDDIRARLLSGGDGNDVLEGYATPDELRGNGGDDTLIGQGGADNLYGDAGKDKLYGGEGSDYLDGGQDDDTLDGGAGDNFYSLKIGSGRDVVERRFDDWLVAKDTVLVPSSVGVANVEVTREGDDVIFQIKGTSDSIRIKGVMINDGIFRGYGFQYGVSGGSNVDLSALKAALLHGGGGNDSLTGYATDDSMTGAAGNDTIFGKAGNDTIEGGLGNDSITGGLGSDTYVFAKNDGQDTLYSTYDATVGKTGTLQFKSGIASSDVVLSNTADGSLIIKIKNTSDQITVRDFLASDNTANPSNPIQQIKFTDGLLTWDVPKILSTLFAGTASADAIYGTLNGDTITGLDGADSLYGRAGNDKLSGGIGIDTLYGGEGGDTLDGGAGNDILYGGKGAFRDDGNNTYLFGKLDGQDTLRSDTFRVDNQINTLQFKSGVGPGEVTLTKSGDDLIVSIANSTDKVTAERFFYGDNPSGRDNPLQRITFTDSTQQWDLAAIKNSFLVGTDAAQTLKGYLSADSIYGAGGSDEIGGLAGNDTIDGGAGDDLIYGGDNRDEIQGGANDDRLYGEDGDDTIDGGTGNDTLNGGLGNDIFKFGKLDGQDYISDSEDLSASKLNTLLFKEGVNPGEVAVSRLGDDLILSIANSTDRITIESYFYNNNPANNLNPVQQIKFDNDAVWNTATIQQFLAGYVGGGSGADDLSGQAIGDSLNGGAGNDTLSGGLGNDTLRGDDDNDLILGGADNDRLYGGDGDDTLEGGQGNDTLVAGLGNETYVFGKTDGQDYISDSEDATPGKLKTLLFKPDVAASEIAALRSGDNLVVSIVNTTDRVTVESFFYGNDPGNDLNPVQQIKFADGSAWGTGAIQQFIAAAKTSGSGTITGTATSNKLYGSTGNDTLNALAGADFLFGGQGNDSLDGGADNDWLYGEDGIDTLTGGLGADTMVGGNGRDTYYVDNLGDKVVEQAGADGGYDSVFSSITYVIPDNVEVVTLTGSGNIDAIGGPNALGLELIGNSGNNRLVGSIDFDVLQGNAGVDTLEGGYGDDYYIITDKRNTVVEQAGADAGQDTIWAYTDGITMNDNVEELHMLGDGAFSATGSKGADLMFGNASANTMLGMAGNDGLAGGLGNDKLDGGEDNDRLDGGGGQDTLIGGAGNDVYTSYDAQDTYTELAGGGYDTIWSYADGVTMGANVETMFLMGGALSATGSDEANGMVGNFAANTLHGLGGNDTITAREGDDVLYGDAGNDSLIGGKGNDALWGGTGNDIYAFSAGDGSDVITEIDPASGNLDTLEFKGSLSASQLWFRKLNQNLEISVIGTTDKVTIVNWYQGDAGKVEQIRALGSGKTLLSTKVDALVTEMAKFTAPPALGQTTLPANYQAALNNVIATSWA